MTKFQKGLLVKEKKFLKQLQNIWDILEEFAQEQKQELDGNTKKKWRTWTNISAITSLISLILFLMVLIGYENQNYLIKNQLIYLNQLNSLLVLFLIFLFISFISFIISTILHDKSQVKKQKKNLIRGKERQEVLIEQSKKIIEILEDDEVLDILEKSIDQLIKERENRQKSVYNTLLFLAIFIIYFFYSLIFGDIVKNLSTDQRQWSFIVSFVLPLIVAILKCWLDESFFNNLIIFDRCKLLIQTTRTLINEKQL